MSKVSLLDNESINTLIKFRLSEISDTTNIDIPEILKSKGIYASLQIRNYFNVIREEEEEEGEEEEEEGEEEEEEEEEVPVTVKLIFNSYQDEKIHLKGKIYFSDIDGSPIIEIGDKFEIDIENHNGNSIQEEVDYELIRDYRVEDDDGLFFNITLTIEEASFWRDDNGPSTDDSSSADRGDEKTDIMFGPENRSLKKFDGHRKLKEFVMGGSTEEEGWKTASDHVIQEIHDCEKIISTFPEDKEKLETELAELKVEEKILEDRLKLMNAETSQLQSNISNMEQKNYILDRKLKTHQVISLADSKDISQLLENSFSDSQIQLLLYNLAVLRKRVLEETGEGDLCLICLEDRRSVVMEPCGHLSVCASCSKDLSCRETRSCPQCAQPYRRTTRVSY